MTSPIFHIPHASRAIPAELALSFLPDQERLEYELLIMTDAWTDKLVEPISTKAKRVLFPVSRLVVDPERFLCDDDEPMSAKGMGAPYTQLSSGEPLRRLTVADRNHLISTYYIPHHAALSAAVAADLDASYCSLIVDVHSFSSKPLPHELDQSLPRPEICIGVDEFHSPFPKGFDIISACGAYGFGCSVNKPFSGSIVPSAFWNRDHRVKSFMIEVRRDLYMNEKNGVKLGDFDATSKSVCALISALIEHRTVK